MKKIKDFLKNTLIFNIYYNILFKIQNIKKRQLNKYFNNLNILSDIKTVDEIVKSKKSLARFGDGEFKWLLNEKDTPAFQENSQELANALKEVIKEEREELIIGIPLNLQYLKNATELDKYFWRKFINEYGEKLEKHLSINKIYANTNLTRFYVGYKDKEKSEERISNIRRIWDKRDVVIVEGELSRVGVGNDLLYNTNSIKRIIGPSKNAFSKYKEILEAICKNVTEDELILLALGPTATVLASELSKIGYQAIDIGHVDIEYEWYKSKAKMKIGVKGKSVNEADDKSQETYDITDKNYLNSIICKI